jgi:hypothetical protein
MPWAMVVLLTFLVAFFGIPIGYIIYYRNEPIMQTRSPKMIVICLFFLACDSIINAFIFQVETRGHAASICRLGMFSTGFMFVGAMVLYLARMYRMFKFFSLYEICLIQKKIAAENLCQIDNKKGPVLSSVMMNRKTPAWPETAKNKSSGIGGDSYFPTALVS